MTSLPSLPYACRLESILGEDNLAVAPWLSKTDSANKFVAFLGILLDTDGAVKEMLPEKWMEPRTTARMTLPRL